MQASAAITATTAALLLLALVVAQPCSPQPEFFINGLNCNNTGRLPEASSALVNAVDVFIASQTGGFDLTCCPGGFCISGDTRYARTVSPCSDACPILLQNVTVGAADCRYNTLVTTPDVCSVTLTNDLGPCGLAPPPSPVSRPPPPPQKLSLLEKKKRVIENLG